MSSPTRFSLAHGFPLALTLILALVLSLLGPGAAQAQQRRAKAWGDFPRLMGMNVGEKRYADHAYQTAMSKMDVVVLGFFPGWRGPSPKRDTAHDVVRKLKSLNPDLLVGQYSILQEAYPFSTTSLAENDIALKLNREGWWLLDSRGNKVQWSSEWRAWDVNITSWAKPDAQGKRFSEWLAERETNIYFKAIPELSIVFLDNAFGTSRTKEADWKRNGTNLRKDDPEVVSQYRQGQVRFWDALRKLNPNLLLIANSEADFVNSAEYRNRLNGVFLEGRMGLYWSEEKKHGWRKMMQDVGSASINLLAPKIVGFNVWGDVTDYRFFRFALASCLMEDAFFSFTDKNGKYGTLPLFDEYEVILGKALEPPVRKPTAQGVFMRTFEKGLAIVNPEVLAVSVDVPKGYATFKGRQDPSVNTGMPVSRVTLQGRDGIILVRK